MGKRINGLKYWYENNERKISVSSLVVGFIIDSLTLQGIDNFYDNLWITSNLVIAGFCIILLSRRGEKDEEGFWIPNILQFSFGALLGSIFVFYLRATTIAVTWPFFALLANEFFQKRYARLAFQISFWYFSCFSFSIFLVPLAVGKIGPSVFVLSGGASLIAIWFFLKLLNRFAKEKLLESRTHIWSFIITIFLLVNGLYFTNLIPPIPLSLQEAGVYHSLEKNAAGNYAVSEEVRGVEKYFTLRPLIHWRPGDPLYVYTAIYSPGALSSADIEHDWQYEDASGEWVTATRIPLKLVGGRSGGFRTYSSKFNFTPGNWRVDVKTMSGQIIGRVNFKIVESASMPPLMTSIK